MSTEQLQALDKRLVCLLSMPRVISFLGSKYSDIAGVWSVEPKGSFVHLPWGPKLEFDTININPGGEQANIGGFVLHKTSNPDILKSEYNVTKNVSDRDNWGRYSYRVDEYAQLTVQSNTQDEAVFKFELFVKHSYFNFNTKDPVDNATDRGLRGMTVRRDSKELHATLT